MSDIFGLDPQAVTATDAEARANGISPDEIHPGFFRGVGSAVGLGIMRGGARTGQFIGMAGGGLLQIASTAAPVESDLGPQAATPKERELAAEQLSDRYFGAVDRYANNAVDYWTPRASEVGAAGRILGGLAEATLPLMAGAGNPTLLIGSQEMGTAADLAREGVSPAAAVGTGLIQGVATAAGFKVPFLGKTLLQRVTSGALGNLAMGGGAALASRELLKAAGEDAAAESFNPLDAEARIVDILTGLAFGGIAHVQLRADARAAAATAAKARHFQEETAPGVPKDINAEVAHQDALETSIDQILRGDKIAVPEKVTEAEFSPREFVEQSLKEREAAVREFLPVATASKNPIPVAEKLSPAERVVETRFRDEVGSDIDAAMAAYSKLEDSQNGKVLNTDVARELSADYLKDRTLSAAVHEPASYLVKRMYTRKLAEAPGTGEEPLVIFSAGGTGAGKTSGLTLLSDVVNSAQIIYDTNLNNLRSSIQKIDQALTAGKDVHIVYTYREPIESLSGGALSRAMRQEKKFGSGRTVPVDEHIRTHVGARETIERLAAHYAGDKRVTMDVIDNSGGKGATKISTLREIPKFSEGAYNSLRERALKAIEAEHSAGRISEAVRRGFAGERPEARSPSPANHSGDRGQSQSSGDGRVDDPLTASVRERLSQSDLQIPTGEIDANGNAITRSAREALAEADAGITEAENMGRAVMAAVTCAIQRGAG